MFIKLGMAWFNVDRIRAITPVEPIAANGNSKSRIYYTDEDYWSVEETPEEIIALIEAGKGEKSK